MGNSANRVNNAFAAWSMAHQRLIELERQLAACPVSESPELRVVLELRVMTVRHRTDQLLVVAMQALARNANPACGGGDAGADCPGGRARDANEP